MVVGSSLIPYRGTWDANSSYHLGDVVLRTGVLYQAVTDTTATPGTTAAAAGHGNPGSWVAVTTDVLQLTGSTDPTTGSGVPAAIGSTYQQSGVGLLTKTGASATAWSSASGGGAQVLTLRTFTLNFDDPGFTDPFGSAIVLWTPAAGDIILDLWCIPTIQFAGATKAVLYVGGNVWFDALIAAVSDNNDTPDLIAIAPPNPSTDFGTGQSASNSTLDARASQLSMPSSSGPSANNPIRFVRGLPALVNGNGTAVVAGVTVTGGPLTAGQIKVYALTATPA